jgi:hypothetical protein
MKPRRVTLNEKTFGLEVRIQIGGSIRSAKAECMRHCDVEVTNRLDNSNGWTIVSDCFAFIWLDSWPEAHHDGTFGTLVHELVHVVRGFLKHVGCKDEEAHANLTQFLYAEAHKKLGK